MPLKDQQQSAASCWILSWTKMSELLNFHLNADKWEAGRADATMDTNMTNDNQQFSAKDHFQINLGSGFKLLSAG